ncbi:hypothetical protein Gasu_02450 isoform 1 [Galdieria sulphuraria]|uniref:Uncharacterized protein n=1 Tax=Galdieria sulphuraria TaxID=130081 RepID=M2X7G7_GALSU|nr:hypothetical protein Gasu_02450 isoform 1 [Galdieria sulphuraria]EME32465.1 hypothetical protein isoform 1 [Galdieria sulphuraria]|eukprot:XP_005708985.1 hypothetical protein isoform 1 [Galdieria sulphuraria]
MKETTGSTIPGSPPPTVVSRGTYQRRPASPVDGGSLRYEKSTFPSSQGKVTIGNFKKRLTRKVTAALSSDLESAVLKATKPKYSRPKEKHVQFLLQATKGCSFDDYEQRSARLTKVLEQTRSGSSRPGLNNLLTDEKFPQREKSQSSLFNLDGLQDRHTSREKNSFIRTCDVLRKLWKKMQAEDWRIATKALVVLHRLINESSEGDAHVIKMQLLQMSRYGVDSSLFPKNTSQYSKIVVDIGNLNATFEDHSRNRPEAPVCSAFLKKYGRYVSRRLEVFQFLSSQSTIYSFNELGILKENMGENSLGEETLCTIDKAVEVVIAPALEQIASDVTYLYNFLNRILKLSVDLVNNKNLSKSSLKIAYDDFVRLEPEVRHFVKYTCSTIEDSCLDVPAVLDTKGITHFSSLFCLEPPIFIDFDALNKQSSKWNLEEEEQQKANAMEETVSIGPQDSNDKDSSRSDMEQSNNNNNNNNNGEVNTLKHKVGMYSEVYSSSREQQLLRAAFIGLKEEVSCLIEAGVSTNVCDDDMRTPLHLAAAVGHVDIVKLLLDAGAEVNAMDCRGKTPLADAIRGRHQKVIECLQSYGGSTSSPSFRKQPSIQQYKSMSSPLLPASKLVGDDSPRVNNDNLQMRSQNLGTVDMPESSDWNESIENKELDIAMKELQIEYEQQVESLELEMRKRRLELDEEFAKKRAALLTRRKQRYRRASFGV